MRFELLSLDPYCSFPGDSASQPLAGEWEEWGSGESDTNLVPLADAPPGDTLVPLTAEVPSREEEAPPSTGEGTLIPLTDDLSPREAPAEEVKNDDFC